MKALLVGLHNPLSNDPSDALLPWPGGSTGNMMLALLQERRATFTQFDYLDAFERTNLWNSRELPPKNVLDREGYRLRNRVLREHYGDVVLLGVKVWGSVMTAYSKDTRVVPFFGSTEVEDTTFWYLPQPSTRAFIYNDAGRRRRAADILLKLADGVIVNAT